MAGALLFMGGIPIFAATTLRKPLDCLALIASGGLHSWVPQDCGKWRDSLFQAVTHGHCAGAN